MSIPSVQRIYLDQAHWMNFVRMEIGRTGYERFRPIFELAADARRMGIVSFPLSDVHYFETWNNPAEAGRRDIARTMMRLARRPLTTGPATLLSRTQAIDMELDLALAKRFGRPQAPRIYPVFGEGSCHSFRPWVQHCGCTQDDEDRWLTLSDADIVAMAPYRDGWKAESALYVAREQRWKVDLPAVGPNPQRRREYMRSRLIGDIRGAVLKALPMAGISGEEFDALGHDGWAALMDDMPSFRVERDLQIERYQNPQLPRKANDLGDLHFLGVAVAYCDVVVTEGQWVRLAQQAGLDGPYKTILLDDLTKLVPILSASMSGAASVSHRVC